MTPFLKWAVAASLLSSAAGPANLSQKKAAPPSPPAVHPSPSPKIQAAILLDVSNSMDGLIEQAKSQLWNMVSVMGKARCNGAAPQIEIALYEYGSPRNEAAKGYVKQLSPFTTDLDGLSQTLFGLKTNGGDEYCGQVIYTAINDLSWDTAAASYKVIFIAGNEDFLQGSVHYTRACTAAKNKGILVNTVYCGDKMQGIREHWNLGGECGGGDYTNINQDAKEEEIPTPYDSSLLVLNTKLNGTYIGYGTQGLYGYAAQAKADKLSYNAGKPRAMLSRIAVKGNGKLYNNAAWDLVDAADKDGVGVFDTFDKGSLPDSLQKLTRPQLKEYVKKKSSERAAVQTAITALAAQREKYLTEERKKRATDNQQTLETETERLLKAQARKFNMVIE